LVIFVLNIFFTISQMGIWFFSRKLQKIYPPELFKCIEGDASRFKSCFLSTVKLTARERASKTGSETYVFLSWTWTCVTYIVCICSKRPQLGLSTGHRKKKDLGFLCNLRFTVKFITTASRSRENFMHNSTTWLPKTVLRFSTFSQNFR